MNLFNHLCSLAFCSKKPAEKSLFNQRGTFIKIHISRIKSGPSNFNSTANVYNKIKNRTRLHIYAYVCVYTFMYVFRGKCSGESVKGRSLTAPMPKRL